MFKLFRNRRGQGMVEYILIIAFVVGIVLVAYKTMGGKVETQFKNAAEKVEKADQKQPG
jgi:Flp pilus assembly pilin Flp